MQSDLETSEGKGSSSSGEEEKGPTYRVRSNRPKGKSFFSWSSFQTEPQKELVINLWPRASSPVEECALNSGWGFVPTPRYNAFGVRVDFYKLMRQIKFKTFFGADHGTTTRDMEIFSSKSTFVPASNDPCINAFEN